jgi:hypothetical protein
VVEFIIGAELRNQAYRNMRIAIAEESGASEVEK